MLLRMLVEVLGARLGAGEFDSWDTNDIGSMLVKLLALSLFSSLLAFVGGFLLSESDDAVPFCLF